MMVEYIYEGQELHLFERAAKWKKYFGNKIQSFISGEVLEVGAGIGETTPYLQNKKIKRWLCLEPDQNLFALLQKKVANKKLPPYCDVKLGTLQTLSLDAKFDTIIYIDVLEHIENDKSEIEAASLLLKESGHLIILAPAHQRLYSEFDKAIGHQKRYSKGTLRAIADPCILKEEKVYFLESASIILLLINKLFLRKRYPSTRDIWIWQNIFIPVSKVADKILFYKVGKSIVCIWKKLGTN
jgi:cyclopropane fatty-acyl-phospholipid synthase-like methyltransferase